MEHPVLQHDQSLYIFLNMNLRLFLALTSALQLVAVQVVNWQQWWTGIFTILFFFFSFFSFHCHNPLNGSSDQKTYFDESAQKIYG